MNTSNSGSWTRFQSLLEARRDALRAEMRAQEQRVLQSHSDAAHEVVDQKDGATTQQQDEISSAQEQLELHELGAVEAALLRIAKGTYGFCADCGEAIPLARLELAPATLCCAPCQAARERHR
ncbi:MAG: TraR/DksA family transcriptional regulator, partial [Paucibacter sp.]|nr:TraR/DksA family transcriptional regulator [Roseateles sp.]